MIEIQVSVTCNTCGLTETEWFDDTWEIERFIDDLDDWDEDRETCPNCNTARILVCTWCNDTSGDTIEESEWTQFSAADLKSVITLCNNCSAQHAALRIP